MVQQQRTRGCPRRPCNTCSIDPMNRPCLKNDVVCQLQYKECCEQYIGETLRSLESRLTEHSADARLQRQSTSWGCHFANKHPSCKVTSAATVFPKQNLSLRKEIGLAASYERKSKYVTTDCKSTLALVGFYCSIKNWTKAYQLACSGLILEFLT